MVLGWEVFLLVGALVGLLALRATLARQIVVVLLLELLTIGVAYLLVSTSFAADADIAVSVLLLVLLGAGELVLLVALCMRMWSGLRSARRVRA